MWLLMVLACVQPDRARFVLEREGYSDITVTRGGWAPLSCSGEVQSATSFFARNPHGHMVEGVVCCDLVTCDVRVWE